MSICYWIGANNLNKKAAKNLVNSKKQANFASQKGK